MSKQPVPTFPYPERNPDFLRDEDIVFLPGYPLHADEYHRMYERAEGGEARLLRLQYLSVEEELERAYRYVLPCDRNARAFSFEFAEVIRSAAGAYEGFSKTLHARFRRFDPRRQRLDVYNYLALDRSSTCPASGSST